jgi:hypothetical protein
MSEHPEPQDAKVEPPSEVARSSETSSALAAARRAVPGRLIVLSGLSLLLGALPLPIVPSRLLRQVRGAVAHDVLARHGLSLVSDAREALAQPDTDDRMRTLVRKGVEFASRRILRRLGPFAVLTTVATAFEVYALGHLLERYVTRVRPTGTVRMHEAEAHRVRKAINSAVLHLLSPGVETRKLTLPDAPEDLRDDFTRWIDTLLITGASLPSYIERRLEAAFDKVVSQSPELGEQDP